MAIRIYKRTSAGRRNASVNLFSEVTKASPEKSLLEPMHKNGGRNHSGKITVQSRGGGHKRRYRRIDFRRNKDGVAATVVGTLANDSAALLLMVGTGYVAAFSGLAWGSRPPGDADNG